MRLAPGACGGGAPSLLPLTGRPAHASERAAACTAAAGNRPLASGSEARRSVIRGPSLQRSPTPVPVLQGEEKQSRVLLRRGLGGASGPQAAALRICLRCVSGRRRGGGDRMLLLAAAELPTNSNQ